MAATNATKGHWRKGRSRNLAPAKLPVALTLVHLLKLAIAARYRHPSLGKLSYRVVGAHLKVDAKTVHKWAARINLPPLWALDSLRALLRDFEP